MDRWQPVANADTRPLRTRRGDEPLASQLNPPPLDLAVHMPLHPDGALFSFIKWGIEGTAMPSFAERLKDEQIWHIVNFIQTIPP